MVMILVLMVSVCSFLPVVPPNISGQTEVPENVSVVVKNPVALSCEASGIPLPAITWLKDGQPISVSGSVRVISGGSSLCGFCA